MDISQFRDLHEVFKYFIAEPDSGGFSHAQGMRWSRKYLNNRKVGLISFRRRLV